jgi:SnoaL-like protein
MDDAATRALITEHYENAGIDEVKVHEIYTDDAVLEFPQGRERIRGKANMYAFRSAFPAKVRLKMWRITGGGDVWVNHGHITYDDAPPSNSVTIMEFRGDKVFRETVYICDPWDPPAWRAQWVEPMTEL